MRRSPFPLRGTTPPGPARPVITVEYDSPPDPLPSLVANPRVRPAPVEAVPDRRESTINPAAEAPLLGPARGDAPVPPSFVTGQSALPLSMVLNGVSEAVQDAWPIPVWVEAEVAKWRPHGSGHIYLELVERNAAGQEQAKANARIWATHAGRLVQRFEASTGERLRDGIRSQWRVKPEFSPRYGFGLTIDDIRAVWTPGAHERKKQAIRERLKADGLWAQQRAWAMPSVITRIGVVAPFDAAGWGDFASEAQRWDTAGLVRTFLRTATFEGDKTSASVSAALTAFAQEQRACLDATGRPAYDLVIVLRGGGAKTALAWMDDEAIVRAIATFPGPVWSAIGHEQDEGLPDEVAAWSAHTPSKAAQRIWDTLVQETTRAAQAWEEIVTAVKHRPQQLELEVDHQWALVRQDAQQRLDQLDQGVAHRWDSLRRDARARVDRLGEHVDELVREVVGLGPAATLERGYVLVQDADGRLMRSADRPAPAPWTLRWADGERRVHPVGPADLIDPAVPSSPAPGP